MNAFPIIVLVALIPVAAMAGNDATEIRVDSITTSAESVSRVQSDSAIEKCQGRKCAGPGDTIRSQPVIQDMERLSGNRGGQTTSGGKKGARHLEDVESGFQTAGNRGGEATAGSKKGSRHSDTPDAGLQLAGNRGGQASSGAKKGARHADVPVGEQRV